MKTKGSVAISAFTVPAVFGSTALAAMSGREDNSSLVVWIFLGFCALIVVAQLLPLLLQLRIFARMRREETPEAETVEVPGEK